MIAIKQKRIWFTGFLVVVFLLWGRSYLDGMEPVHPRWELSQSIGGSVNPIGLDLTTRLSHKAPLYEGKSGLLWDSTFWEAGVENSLTPAFNNLSFLLRIVPIAFLDLRFLGGIRYAHNVFGFGYTPLASYDAPFDVDTREGIEKKSGLGFRNQLSATLRGAVQDLLFATTFHYVFFDMSGIQGVEQEYFYEPVANLILRERDGYWGNDSILAYRIRHLGLTFGLMHTLLHVPASGYTTSRVSLLGSFTRELFHPLELSITTLVGMYPQDRYLSYETGKVYGALLFRFVWKEL